MNRAFPNLLLASLFVWTGCSSSAPVAQDSPDLIVVGPTRFSEAETLDVEAFGESAPVRETELVHDVPLSLMNSKADDGTLHELPGFRVQIFSSIERSETVELEERARRWLRARTEIERADLNLGEVTAVYNFFRQPYYRVRIGDFESRSDAARLANRLRFIFPGSLVVPDVIEVVR